MHGQNHIKSKLVFHCMVRTQAWGVRKDALESILT